MKFILISLVLFSFIATPPNEVWTILSKMKFNIEFNEKVDDVVFIPKPSKPIKEMVGKTIMIQGFKSSIIDFESASPNRNTFLLCRYEDERFSCTSSGVESYIEITPKEKLNFKEGVLYTFKGVFELNTKDLLAFPFQLKEADCQNCNAK